MMQIEEKRGREGEKVEGWNGEREIETETHRQGGRGSGSWRNCCARRESISVVQEGSQGIQFMSKDEMFTESAGVFLNRNITKHRRGIGR